MAPIDMERRQQGIREGNAANRMHVFAVTRGEQRPAWPQVGPNKLRHHHPDDLASVSLSCRHMIVGQPALGSGLSAL